MPVGGRGKVKIVLYNGEALEYFERNEGPFKDVRVVPRWFPIEDARLGPFRRNEEERVQMGIYAGARTKGATCPRARFDSKPAEYVEAEDQLPPANREALADLGTLFPGEDERTSRKRGGQDREEGEGSPPGQAPRGRTGGQSEVRRADTTCCFRVHVGFHGTLSGDSTLASPLPAYRKRFLWKVRASPDDEERPRVKETYPLVEGSRDAAAKPAISKKLPRGSSLED
ncbi:hypothetical protein KM043_012268 [Ampulex compressa]|nr:hypothetical protein KM043_012268 [Ampulex compressa]